MAVAIAIYSHLPICFVQRSHPKKEDPRQLPSMVLTGKELHYASARALPGAHAAVLWYLSTISVRCSTSDGFYGIMEREPGTARLK